MTQANPPRALGIRRSVSEALWPADLRDIKRWRRAYKHEMSDEQNRELADALNAARGRVAFPNYECKLLDQLYRAPQWRTYRCPPRTNHATKGKRVEVLWMNYIPTSTSGSGATQLLFQPGDRSGELCFRTPSDMTPRSKVDWNECIALIAGGEAAN